MLDLGSAVATIDLNITNFVSKAAQAESVLNNLDGAGTNTFSGAEKSATSFSQKLDAMSGKLVKFGGVMTAAVTTPVLGAFGLMFNGAADLEQTMGAVPKVFGAASDSMVAWSENSADAFGLTQNEALNSANIFGAMFKQLGVGEDQVASLSREFVGLSADLSAMWGGTSQEASAALTSALRGNYESMDKYGVTLTEAMVSQEAMNVALAAGRDEVTEADKIQARYNLIMKQTADAQGQFADEADTASGAMAIFKANMGDAAAGLGKLLLPAGTKAAKMLTDLVKRIDGLSDTQKKGVLGIAGAAAAIGPLAVGLGTAMKAVNNLISVFRVAGTAIAFLTSPIGLVVLGIAALAAGLIYAYQHFEPFRNAVDRVVGTVTRFASALKDAFDADGWSGVWDLLSQGMQAFADDMLTRVQGLSDRLQAWIQGLADRFIAWGAGIALAGAAWIQGLWDGAVSRWDAFTGWVSGLVGSVVAWVTGTASALWSKGSELLQGLWDGAVSKWNEFTTWISDLWTDVTTWVDVTTSTLLQQGKDLIQGFFDGVKGKWQGVTSWFGEIKSKVITAIGDPSFLTNLGKGIIDSLKAGAKSGWDSFTSWLEGAVNGAIDKLNALIGGINTLYSWTGAPSIPMIPKIGEDADASTGKVQALGSALGSVNGTSLESVLGQIRSVQSAAGTAESATTKLMRALRSGTLSTHPKMAPGDATPQPLPEAEDSSLPPVEYGENQLPIGGLSGMPVVFDTIAAAAGRAAAAVLPVNSNIAAIAGQSAAVTAFGGAATSAFTQSGSAAVTGLSPIGGIAAAMASGLTGAAIPAFVGIQASAATNFVGMLSAVTSNTASASSTASSNASSMNTKVAGEMAGMQVKSAAQLVLMAASAASNFSAMQTAATTAGSRLAQEMTNGATRALSGVRSALSQIPGIVSSVGSNAAGVARNVGAMIGAGMAQGMESMLGRIQAAARAMVAAAEVALAARARLGSPSKLFRQMGAWVGEGFEIGILSMVPSAARAAAALVSVPGIGGNTYGSGHTPAYAYAAAPAGVVVNNYHHHHTEYIALSTSDLQRLTEQAERGASYAKTMEQPDAYTQWLGGR
jgi:phage-related protein